MSIRSFHANSYRWWLEPPYPIKATGGMGESLDSIHRNVYTDLQKTLHKKSAAENRLKEATILNCRLKIFP